MGFSRKIIPAQYATRHQLTADLVGIGILLAEKPSEQPNIENTLIAASIEGIEGDFRVLALLVDWIQMHHERIIANRLIKLVRQIKSKKFAAFGQELESC